MRTGELITSVEKMIGIFSNNPLLRIRKGVVSQNEDLLALDFEWTISEAGESRLGADYDDEIIGGQAHIRLPLSGKASAYILDYIPDETEVQHSAHNNELLQLNNLTDEQSVALRISPEEYIQAGIERYFFYGWQKGIDDQIGDLEPKIKTVLQLLGMPALSQNDQTPLP